MDVQYLVDRDETKLDEWMTRWMRGGGGIGVWEDEWVGGYVGGLGWVTVRFNVIIKHKVNT